MSRASGVFILFVGLAMSLPMMSGGPGPCPGQAATSTGKLPRGADLVLLHGKIWTGEPAGKTRPAAGLRSAGRSCRHRQWALLRGGQRMTKCAPTSGLSTRVIDLQGRLAVPGLIDSHVHFVDGGFQLLRIDLKDARSEEEFVRRIAEKAKTLPPGRWLLGGNWDEQAWPSAKLPTRWLIDAVTPNNPVFINRYDGHAALANSLALKLAGVTRATPEPSGGVIVRDPQSGEPTGVLKDAAEELVARVIPRPTEAEMEEALKAASGRGTARRRYLVTQHHDRQRLAERQLHE